MANWKYPWKMEEMPHQMPSHAPIKDMERRGIHLSLSYVECVVFCCLFGGSVGARDNLGTSGVVKCVKHQKDGGGETGNSPEKKTWKMEDMPLEIPLKDGGNTAGHTAGG